MIAFFRGRSHHKCTYCTHGRTVAAEHKNVMVSENIQSNVYGGGGGGGGTPIYKPYRYVPPQRVPFSSISGLK